MDQFSNEELMEEMEGTFTSVRAKEIVKGKIIYVTDNEVMVNIGYKSDGIIKQDELSDEPGVSPKDLEGPTGARREIQRRSNPYRSSAASASRMERRWLSRKAWR